MVFSIVMPVLNGARFLGTALECIRRQRGEKPEFIIVDGGSTDGSAEVASEARDVVTKFQSGKDSGMYDALCRGFRLATGDILGWLNCDDVLMPWCLSVVRRYFDAFPECQWVTGVPTMLDADGDMVWTATVIPHYRRSWIARGWYSARGLGAIQQESTFFRRSLYEKVGGLDSKFRLAGDFDLWRRFARHAELHQLGTVIAGFRLHGANMSANLDRYLEEAQAPRIPMGTFLGSTYSFAVSCARRLRRERRFKDVALPGSVGTHEERA